MAKPRASAIEVTAMSEPARGTRSSIAIGTLSITTFQDWRPLQQAARSCHTFTAIFVPAKGHNQTGTGGGRRATAMCRHYVN